MKIEKRPILVTDRGEKLDSDHADHILQLVEVLQQAHILSGSGKVPLSKPAALRIVEALLNHSGTVLQVLSD